jgi:hypothetical protein
MKRLIILLFLLFITITCFAGQLHTVDVITRNNAGEGAAFCPGGELFCSDFETDPSFDSNSGNLSSDCDGYDADGDYCVSDTTTYKNGSQAFGIRGDNSYYTEETISATSEFTGEFWYRTDATDSQIWYITELLTSGDARILLIYHDTDGHIRAYSNAGVEAIDSKTYNSNTWYHFKYYYKEDTGAGNGIITIWSKTSDGDFEAGDITINETDVVTGSVDAEKRRWYGPRASNTGYFDNDTLSDGAL